MHGFATLWNTGNLDSTEDPEELARRVAAMLFGDD